jgi:hypothetical protein
VAPSRITGLGLFAGTRIPARAKIGEFEGEVIGLREARRRARGRQIVAIVELERHAIDATDTGRGFRFINHSCAPNTYIRCTPSARGVLRVTGYSEGCRAHCRLWGDAAQRKAALAGVVPRNCRGAI